VAIDFDKFITWAESRFGDIKVKGHQVKINSIFTKEPDYKYHLECNPYGGKKGAERPNGVYHCWKTGEKGTLVGLVMQVDHVPYEDALEILDGNMALSEIERMIEEMYDSKPPPQILIPQAGIDLPEETHRICELDESDLLRISAESYLLGRRLPIGDLMVCGGEDEFKNRLIIPYYDRTHRLVYFNARYLGRSKDVPKYLGPSVEIGIGKGDVVYMPDWPVAGTEVYLTEGEFDAMSLILSGLSAGAFGGKVLSENQAQLLRDYLPVLCLDNDKAGKYAIKEVGEYFLSQGFSNFSYVRPPEKYKDWNEMLVKLGPRLVKAYVLSNKKAYDDFTSCAF
jgi:DNA primase